MYQEIPNSFDFQKVKDSEEKSKLILLNSLRLTDRDFKVLEFIGDMKFATVADLYQKFFKTWKSENPKSSELYTRERLQIFRKHGLVKIERHAFDFRNFYLVTAKAIKCLEARFPERMWPRPLTRIDIRTFEHDKTVNSLRLHLEEKQMVSFWLSDRLLNTDHSLTNDMPKDYLPDAIYTSSQNQKVAFEFENSPKTRSKYLEKIKHYVDIMRNQDSSKRIFEKVHYVVVRDNIFRFLKESTEIYGDLFQVEKLSHVLPLTIEKGRK